MRFAFAGISLQGSSSMPERMLAMPETKNKFKLNLAPSELSRFLHRLADAVDGRGDAAGPLFDTLRGGFSQLELRLKRKDGEVFVKLKSKSTPPDFPNDEGASTGPLADAPSEFKALKKQMQTDFGRIGDRLAGDRIPEPASAARFLRASEQMTRFAGSGDEHYPDYREACAEFSQAFEGSDLAGLKRAYDRLKSIKIECHRKHK
jgi:XXXCH domain-containing protein